MPTVGSLFSGIGGLDLGLERAEWEVRWQVENDAFCQRVLAKHWPGVRRYGDVRAFPGADTEPVDLICGGFPCQPVSVAGKRLAQADARWLWPEFARVIRALRPCLVLVENVPGLLARGVGDVLGDLAACGYDAEWDCIPASAVGAPHQRDRVWIVAYSRCEFSRGLQPFCESRGGDEADSLHDGPKESVADAHPEGQQRDERRWTSDSGEVVADAEHGDECGLCERRENSPEVLRRVSSGPSRERIAEASSSGDVADPEGHTGELWPTTGERRWRSSGGSLRDSAGPGLPYGLNGAMGRRAQGDSLVQSERSAWWATEPDVGRVVDGLSFELDIARRLANEQGDSPETESAARLLVGRFLRAMWEHSEIATASPDLYLARLHGALPEMPYGDPCSRWLLGARLTEDQGLRDLFSAFYAQPLEEAQDVQRLLLERIGQKKRPEALGSRVNRLRGLGNAVVPQVAEWIGRRLMEMMRG